MSITMWKLPAPHSSRLMIAVVLSQLLPGSVIAQPRAVAEFAVHAGRLDRVDVPVSVSLEGVPHPSSSGALQLFEITSGADVPVASQLVRGDPARLMWVVHGELSAGRVRNFELRVVPESASPHRQQPGVHADDDGEHIWIRVGDAPVLAYRYGVQPSPAGVDTIYGRGGFIHPLYSPGGEVLTRIQPPDHYHHYGIWNPWTHTELEGRSVDFWNLGARQGTVRPRLVLTRSSGPVAGGFSAVLDHVAFTSASDETVAIREQWTVRVWNISPSNGAWLIDFVSTLDPVDRPITISAYRYQGFSLRATERWNDSNVTLLTSEGLGKDDANGTRARWIDVNGVSTTAAGTAGILFMTSPANHNYPEHLRVWPVGANEGRENVFVNLNPAQDRDWELQPGHQYVLRYRMLVYEGSIDQETANRHWSDFAEPPAVDVFPTGALEGARLLVYTRNGEGYVHDNIAASVAAIERMGAENGFAVDVTDDPAVFTTDGLRQFDALLFSNTNNEAFTSDAQRLAFQTYIRRGGGFVGIHSASGSERDWPWYIGLLGGTFVRHPVQQDFTVDVVDRSHPSTSFLPDRWEIVNDECYYLQFLNPHIRILLAADLMTVVDPDRTEFPGVTFGDAFPLAWYHEFDGGRVWYTALGHRPEQYQDPVLMRHLLGGIRWVVAGGRH